MVVSLTDAVNLPIKLTKPSVGVVNWRSMAVEVVRAAFVMLATAFNLRTLWRVWTALQVPGPTHHSQLAEVAVPWEVFRQVLERIGGLHPAPG